MIGCSKKNREKLSKGEFEQRNKETWFKILSWVSANWPSNNWALMEQFPDYLYEQIWILIICVDFALWVDVLFTSLELIARLLGNLPCK